MSEFKYKSLSEFKKENRNDYSFLQRNNLLTRLCEDMNWTLPKSKKPNGYWTKEKCIEEALKYSNRWDWGEKHSSTYSIARIKGWMDDCTKHMIVFKKPRGYWTKNLCIEEALKYSISSEWLKNNKGSYCAAKRNNWFEDCVKHMDLVFRQNQKSSLTKKSCIEEALKYLSIHEWELKDIVSCKFARKKGWMGECTAHMLNIPKARGYWTKEKCIEEASKYSTRHDWKKNCTSYASAKRNKWLDDCLKTNKRFIWTKDLCIAEALKYSTSSEWKKKSSGSYSRASKNKWLDECLLNTNYDK